MSGKGKDDMKERKKEMKRLEKEQKKKEKQEKKDKANQGKKNKVDPASISIGGPVLVKATNEIINRAQERKIPEGHLLYLVESGNLPEIQRIKYPKEELEFRNKHGQTPLHVACQDGSGPNNGYDVAKSLVAMGANVNATDNNGWTVLHAACKYYRSPELVVLLGCVCGQGAGHRNRDGNTPLHFLARVHATAEQTFVCEKGITCLLEHGGDINAKNNSGETPFHCAVMQGNFEMLPLLLKHGADISAVTDNGHNAMHIAVLAENVLAAKKLLELGFDPKLTTATQPSPYDMVKHTRNRRKEICELFQIPDEKVSLLVLFGPECDESDYADIDKLKSWNYSVEEANERDAAGNVPLYYAVINPKVGAPVIQFLLSLGADVNAVATDGRSVLFIACSENRVEVVNALLAAKPDITARDPEHGRLPIHEFVLRGAPKTENLASYEKALDAFFGLGANINGPLSDEYQEKLLHVVTNVTMFKLLIEKEADPTVTTRTGRGILVEAIIKQNKEMVTAILALDKLDPRIGGEEGTAIEVAKRALGDKAQEISQLISREAISWDIRDMTPEEKRAYRRGKAIEELVQTEQEYLADLDILIKLYYLPIKARSEPKEGEAPPEQPLLDGQQIRTIFGDIEKIRETSATMATLLAQCKDTPGQPFGKLFLDNLSLLQRYERVCTTQASTEEFLNKALNDRNPKTNEPSEFAKFCEEVKKNPLCRKLPIGGFIIKPFQRITKLPLLLREIQSLTEETHPDYENLTKAKAEVEKIIGSANQKQKNMDNLRELLAIQNRFAWDDAEEIINLGDNKQRQFLMECDIKAVVINARPVAPASKKKEDDKKPSPRHLFVFHDIVILTKPEKKGVLNFLFHLPLALTFVEDIKDSADAKSNKNSFSLTYVSAQRIVTIICKDPAEKQKLFEAIKTNIEKIRSPDLADTTSPVEERKSGELRGVSSKQVAYITTDLGLPQPSVSPKMPQREASGKGTEISAPVLGATTNPHVAASVQGTTLVMRPSVVGSVVVPNTNTSPGRSALTMSLNIKTSGGITTTTTTSPPTTTPQPGSGEWARDRIRSMDMSNWQHHNNNSNNNNGPTSSIHQRFPRPQSVHNLNLQKQHQQDLATTTTTSPTTTPPTTPTTTTPFPTSVSLAGPPSQELPPTPPPFTLPSGQPPPPKPAPTSFSPSGPISFSPSGGVPSNPRSTFSAPSGVSAAGAGSRPALTKMTGSYFTIRDHNKHHFATDNNTPQPSQRPQPPSAASVFSPPPPSHNNNHNTTTNNNSHHSPRESEVGSLQFGKFEKNLNATLKKKKKPSKGFMAAIDHKRVVPHPAGNK